MFKKIDRDSDTMLFKLDSEEKANTLVSDVWHYCKNEHIEGNIVQLWNINEYFTMMVASDLDKFVDIVETCIETL